MLGFTHVACRRDGVSLFSDVNLVIQSGQKVGLTGANGSGKSSLFAMIRGVLDPDDGEIHLQQQVVMAHVAQETPATDRIAIEHVIDGDPRLRALEQQLAQAEASGNDGLRHAALLADFEQAGGYHVHARAGALLNGLGFPGHQHRWPVHRFSGGWRMRLNLAQALMSPADLLLLDEPTNHLDLDAVIWLEQWLRQVEGSLLLISHDREFLDRITTHTLHIEHQAITLYSGNYSAFESLRAARLANQQAMYEKQQKKAGEMQRFVDRFRAKATKARQAQSRLKMLERMTLLAPARADSPLSFEFREPEALPSPLVELRDATVGYGELLVLRSLKMTVQSGDRLGLLGANGAGKSTLIKALVGELELQGGERLTAQKLNIGYFAQHQVDQLADGLSALQTMLNHYPNMSDAQARTYLGGFGFQGDRALQSAGTLSGGERARLALALIIYARPNLLLLDEPTNHLDIDMRQALADALQGFDGALIVISHDRTLLRSVVDSLWLVADGGLRPFDDDLDGYARWLAAHRSSALDPDSDGLLEAAESSTLPGSAMDASDDAVLPLPVDRKQQKRDAAERRARLKPLRSAVDRHTRELDRLTAQLDELRNRLTSNELYNSERKQELTDVLAEETRLKRALTDVEEALLDSMLALEEAESES